MKFCVRTSSSGRSSAQVTSENTTVESSLLHLTEHSGAYGRLRASKRVLHANPCQLLPNGGAAPLHGADTPSIVSYRELHPTAEFESPTQLLQVAHRCSLSRIFLRSDDHNVHTHQPLSAREGRTRDSSFNERERDVRNRTRFPIPIFRVAGHDGGGISNVVLIDFLTSFGGVHNMFYCRLKR